VADPGHGNTNRAIVESAFFAFFPRKYGVSADFRHCDTAHIEHLAGRV